MPVFIAKYNEIREGKIKDLDDDQGGEEVQDLLLGTIRVPKNLRLLSERLPKSNYGSKTDRKDKMASLETDKSAQSTDISLIQKAKQAAKELHSIVEESESKAKIAAQAEVLAEERPSISKPPLQTGPRHQKVKSERQVSASSANQNGGGGL